MAWIKIEKELTDKIQFRRFLKAYSSNALLTRDDSLLSLRVTMLLGGLVQLWLYADSHINDDNILTITLNEIDEIVGIENFARSLPTDWLVIIDSDHVQLPDFLQHNGTSSKQRKQNAERQAKHRHKVKTTSTVTQSNALVTVSHARNDARPDQTREEEIKKKTPIPPLNAESITGLDINAWRDWVIYRAKRKPAIKPASMQKAAESLAALGTAQRATVDNSIANGYQGLFAPNLGTNGNGKHRPTRYEQLTAKLDEQIATDQKALASDDGSLRLQMDGDVWG
jgi:hypothetical protein